MTSLFPIIKLHFGHFWYVYFVIWRCFLGGNSSERQHLSVYKNGVWYGGHFHRTHNAELPGINHWWDEPLATAAQEEEEDEEGYRGGFYFFFLVVQQLDKSTLPLFVPRALSPVRLFSFRLCCNFDPWLFCFFELDLNTLYLNYLVLWPHVASCCIFVFLFLMSYKMHGWLAYAEFYASATIEEIFFFFV